MTRDTWDGDYNRPLSLNRWSYADANPILYADPSGHNPIGICIGNATLDARTVNKSIKLSRSYWLNTYVAAGIAVQCWAATLDPFQDSADDTIGRGPAQTTNKELQTGWGKPIKNGEGEPFAYGKLCYIVNKVIGDTNILGCTTVCDDYDNLAKEYGTENVKEEHIIDQTTWSGAAESMRRRISQVLHNCVDCTDTDRFIAAALAQDVQLNMQEMTEISSKSTNNKAAHRLPKETNGLKIDWKTYIDTHISNPRRDGYGQVARFDNAVTELNSLGWVIPGDLVRAGINSLR